MIMGRRTSIFALALAVALAAAPSAALAEETGWLTGYKALTAFRKLERQAMMPVKVQCRDSNKRGLDLWETEYNITVTARPAGLRYYWAVGDAFGPTRIKAEKQGYRQVSLSQYKRQKSGLTIRCAIWHK
jgi:hypothetical protein